MSTSTPPPAAGPHDGERRKSLGKYVKRMSSVFKRDKSSKDVPRASSGAGVSAAAGVVDASAASAVDASAAGAADAPASSVQQPGSQSEDPRTEAKQNAATQEYAQEPAKAESIKQDHPTETSAAAAAPATTSNDLTPTASAHAPAPPTSPLAPVQASPTADRRAMQQERARALFAKYGLTLESHEWLAASAPAPLVPRVEKPIRMRIHRSCHLCGTLYGHDKICAQCEHKRCKYCPRYPKKKTPADKAKHAEAVEQPKKKKLFTVTTRHGNELAYQPATQRVRRTCHKCDALFVPATATVCESCNHARCTKCPREPAKRNKWPSGYPGDAAADSEDDVDMERPLEQFRRIWRKPRRIVRWDVKKQRQQESFDPAVVAAVEAKLKALGVDDDPPTSDPEHV